MSIKSKLHEIKESFKGKKMAPAFNAFHTFLYTPNDVTSFGVKRKVWNALKAGAIFFPLKLSLISCNFDFIDI